ncbi:putative kinase-like protein TMKL1 [Phalaenopsis equestris]|uniref:putative kinase-like protein TMKL1 n=1 Tax=Phalaenopsis equestris TaxID=78828 RepID=UPI0009E36545|nr:putative kinase-like protein TMKL1 [Phalaenopsis equestris]
MKWTRSVRIIIAVIPPFLFLLLIACICYCYIRTRRVLIRQTGHEESPERGDFECAEVEEEEEELVVFAGGEHLKIQDILNAPGQVVAKSSYGTVYRASIKRSSEGDGNAVMLLRFLRPVSIGRSEEIRPAIRAIGLIRHPNLVPLRSLYVGPRGEKLFVYPFYAAGNLAQFLKGESPQSNLSNRWEIIHSISLGIATGLDHLHNGSQKPLIHGNLKSNNIMLDRDLQPRLSDFGLHLLLRPVAAQGMFDALTVEGYKAPELMKIKEASVETDIYSLGIILLEMLTRKDPTSCRLLVLNQKMSDVFSSDIISERKEQSFNIEALLRSFYQLAMACCSPSPALRPDVRQILRKLEEIGQ